MSALSRRFRRPAAAAVLALALAAPAAAQPILNSAVIDIVRSWTAATDLPEPVKDFGETCLLQRLLALPEDMKQIVIDAGNLDDAVEAAALQEVVQACIETMLVGEQIWFWTAGGDAGQAAEDRIACLMDAILPIPTEAKLTLFEAVDFDEGLATLRDENPAIGDPLAESVAACA